MVEEKFLGAHQDPQKIFVGLPPALRLFFLRFSISLIFDVRRGQLQLVPGRLSRNGGQIKLPHISFLIEVGSHEGSATFIAGEFGLDLF